MKICFCLPGSSFTKLNFHSWVKLQRFLDKGDWDYGIRIRYQADMWHVRNGLVLNGDASYIPHEGAEKPFVVEDDSDKQYDLSMWIDSDVVYEPEDFEKIYRAILGHPEADMVTGFYMMNSEKRNTVVGSFATEASDWKTQFHYQDKIKELAEEQKEYDLIPVDFSGFGFVMIKTKVFDAMTYPWFESKLSKRDNGERTFPTSDVFFFKKAKQLGFNLFAHLKVILGHEKMVVLK